MKSKILNIIILSVFIALVLCYIIKCIFEKFKEKFEVDPEKLASDIDKNRDDAKAAYDSAVVSIGWGAGSGFLALESWKERARVLSENAESSYNKIPATASVRGRALTAMTEAKGYSSQTQDLEIADSNLVTKEVYQGCYATTAQVAEQASNGSQYPPARVQALTDADDRIIDGYVPVVGDAAQVPRKLTYLTWKQCAAYARNLNYPYFGLYDQHATFNVNLSKCIMLGEINEGVPQDKLKVKVDDEKCSPIGHITGPIGTGSDQREHLNPYKRRDTSDDIVIDDGTGKTITTKPRLGGRHMIAIYKSRSRIAVADEPIVELPDDEGCEPYYDPEKWVNQDVVYQNNPALSKERNQGPHGEGDHEDPQDSDKGDYCEFRQYQPGSDMTPCNSIADAEAGLCTNPNLNVMDFGGTIRVATRQDAPFHDMCGIPDVNCYWIAKEGRSVIDPATRLWKANERGPALTCSDYIYIIGSSYYGYVFKCQDHPKNAKRCSHDPSVPFNPNNNPRPRVGGKVGRHNTSSLFANYGPKGKDCPIARTNNGLAGGGDGIDCNLPPTKDRPHFSKNMMYCPSLIAARNALTASEKISVVKPDGTMGQVIPAGAPPMPGIFGPPGTPGVKGKRGEKGSPGPKGLDGKDGTPGEKGGKGNKGVSGGDGVKGEKGDGGDGKKGEKGTPGEKGGKGNKGVSGGDGVKGEKGEGGDGKKGEKGTPGEKGSKGGKGLDGGDGAKGEKGGKGGKGLDGGDGAKGEKGLKGIPGQKGRKGFDGQEGAKGLRGLPGPRGPPGGGGGGSFGLTKGRYLSSL